MKQAGLKEKLNGNGKMAITISNMNIFTRTLQLASEKQLLKVISLSPLTSTYGCLDNIKSYFFPEVQYVQEIGDASKDEPFAHYIWDFVDSGNYPLHTGTYGKKEANDKIRISFINGILNVKEDYFGIN